MSPTPKRPDPVQCPYCQTWNDPQRGSKRCRECKAEIMHMSGTETAITPFAFPATGEPVRTVTVDGQPWFIAADVCAVLGYSNGRMAVGNLPERMKSSVTILDGTPGNPNRAIVSEPGVYRLAMRSNLPDAEAFQDWIAEDVVPSVRRTGSYAATTQRELSRKELARYWYEAEERAESAERRAAELEAPAEAWNTLASADPDYSAREAAYILNRDPSISTGQNRLLNELRRMRVIDSRDIPYATHERHVRLRPRTYTNRATGDEHAAKSQVRITAEGLAYLHKKLGGTAPLDLRETENA
jgi:anti-repressor protein